MTSPQSDQNPLEIEHDGERRKEGHPIFKDPDLLTARRVRDRGWSEETIRELLGEPDKRPQNPLHPEGPPLRLYRRERVIEAEQSPRFWMIQNQQGSPQNPQEGRGRKAERGNRKERRQQREHPSAERAIVLSQISIGSATIRGHIRAIYLPAGIPGAENGRQLRNEGRNGWIVNPGGRSSDGILLGKLISLWMDIED